jgi:hypothetical protein
MIIFNRTECYNDQLLLSLFLSLLFYGKSFVELKKSLLFAQKFLIRSASRRCSFAILLTHGDSGHNQSEKAKKVE